MLVVVVVLNRLLPFEIDAPVIAPRLAAGIPQVRHKYVAVDTSKLRI